MQLIRNQWTFIQASNFTRYVIQKDLPSNNAESMIRVEAGNGRLLDYCNYLVVINLDSRFNKGLYLFFFSSRDIICGLKAVRKVSRFSRISTQVYKSDMFPEQIQCSDLWILSLMHFFFNHPEGIVSQKQQFLEIPSLAQYNFQTPKYYFLTVFLVISILCSSNQ